eukprot:167478-Pyramimonas_sp.AAC.1
MAPPRYMRTLRPAQKRYVKKLERALDKERLRNLHLARRLRKMSTQMRRITRVSEDAVANDLIQYNAQRAELE